VLQVLRHSFDGMAMVKFAVTDQLGVSTLHDLSA